jgi:hypothetical protein
MKTGQNQLLLETDNSGRSSMLKLCSKHGRNAQPIQRLASLPMCFSSSSCTSSCYASWNRVAWGCKGFMNACQFEALLHHSSLYFWPNLFFMASSNPWSRTTHGRNQNKNWLFTTVVGIVLRSASQNYIILHTNVIRKCSWWGPPYTGLFRLSTGSIRLVLRFRNLLDL